MYISGLGIDMAKPADTPSFSVLKSLQGAYWFSHLYIYLKVGATVFCQHAIIGLVDSRKQ